MLYNYTYVMKFGPVILVDDDKEDMEFITSAIKNIRPGLGVSAFLTADEAMAYLRKVEKQPFIILSNVLLPDKDGIAFRNEIDNDPSLRKKSIPFVFLTTVIDRMKIERAYDSTIQGYILKGHSFDRLKKVLEMTFTYWENNIHPNNLDHVVKD